MRGYFTAVARARRRAANLRAGRMHGKSLAREPVQLRLGRVHWLGAAALLAALTGAALIAGHARYLARVTSGDAPAGDALRTAAMFQSALPGAQFAVPEQGGVSVSLQPGGALLVLAGMQAAPAVRVDLCSQLRAPGEARLLPLRIGYRFEDVQRWVQHEETSRVNVPLRNVLLVDGQDGEPMPELQLSGMARADFNDPLSEPLQLSWRSTRGAVRWISDASLGQVAEGASAQVGLRQQGWLLWGSRSALRIERRSNAMCPQAGELVVQMYRLASPESGGHSLVVAFPARGKALAAYLAAGRYRVPVTPAAPLEDQSLFKALQDRGLVRLQSSGVIELAPRDLLQWQAAPDSARVAALSGWPQSGADNVARKLLKRLYYQADGAYVRQQIDIFNSERQLLAWRNAATSGASPWRATAQATVPAEAAVEVSTTQQMPAASARLFAELPQGWLPWTRAARWPQNAGAKLRLTLDLPSAANGGEIAQLLLAGRVQAVRGATMQARPACTGRACRSVEDVQQLTLTFAPGARTVSLEVQALDFNAPEDQKYRHLRVDHGALVWHALAPNLEPALRSAAASPTPVQLRDRNGTPLWSDGAPTPAASAAGLAPLLGVSSDHASSVAGVLARLPASTAATGAIDARLTLDLPLQALSQQILDCIGMHRGRWDGKTCSAGRPAPPERHAGLIMLDTETGDVLVAAGAGTGAVTSANWPEVRDFDRISPARSPLRLPALQHDGGAHQSPGSTFKVISALGLELAAQTDRQLDALIGGMPLPAINQLAAQRGFGFQTEAAAYPNNARLAHITNYREQSLNRRAEDGRLGLAQALTYSLNTWFAWSSELSDRSLFGRPDGGAPDLQALDADALDGIRPIVAAAHRLGFEQTMRLDGGLLPADFSWRAWDALQATPAHIDPIHTRHELRQMSIGLRMQVTPLQMALASAAVGQGRVVTPRLLLNLNDSASRMPAAPPLGIRLDRIRAGMKGVVDVGTGAGAFSGPALAALRPGLYGKTGTAPSGEDTATVWFTGWLEPGSLPGQTHRLAMAAFVSHSDATGGEHAAPVLAAILSTLVNQNKEQKGK